MSLITSSKKMSGNAIGRRLLMIGAIVVGLMIPLSLLQGLVSERQGKRGQFLRDLTQGMEQSQTIYGPFLEVQYQTHPESASGYSATAYIAPESLSVTGEMDPKIKERGIFKALLYRSKFKFDGKFDLSKIKPQLEAKFGSTTFSPNSTKLVFAVRNADRIRSVSDLAFQGAESSTDGGIQLERNDIRLYIPVNDFSLDKPGTFAVSLNFAGYGEIKFITPARNSLVKISSPWDSPSFKGEELPVDHEITSDGFSANWELSAFQARSNLYIDDAPDLSTWNTFEKPGLVVELIIPVDGYRAVERTIRYGVLQLVLTCLVFFLFEYFCNLYIHPMQYGIVACALILFSLLLLSFSEFLRFEFGYSLAAGAVIMMITLYSYAVLRAKGRAITIFGLLSGLYAILYTILVMEDFSLVSGSILLTISLAIVMYITKDMNIVPQKTVEAES